MEDGMKQVQEFVKLSLQIRKDEEKLNLKKKQLADMEEKVKDYFLQSESQSIKLKQGLAYLHRDIFASVNLENFPNAYSVLQGSELGDLVKPTVNSNSLRARLKEIIPPGVALEQALSKVLPKKVVEVLNVAEVYRVRVRKSN